MKKMNIVLGLFLSISFMQTCHPMPIRQMIQSLSSQDKLALISGLVAAAGMATFKVSEKLIKKRTVSEIVQKGSLITTVAASIVFLAGTVVANLSMYQVR